MNQHVYFSLFAQTRLRCVFQKLKMKLKTQTKRKSQIYVALSYASATQVLAACRSVRPSSVLPYWVKTNNSRIMRVYCRQNSFFSSFLVFFSSYFFRSDFIASQANPLRGRQTKLVWVKTAKKRRFWANKSLYLRNNKSTFIPILITLNDLEDLNASYHHMQLFSELTVELNGYKPVKHYIAAKRWPWVRRFKA